MKQFASEHQCAAVNLQYLRKSCHLFLIFFFCVCSMFSSPSLKATASTKSYLLVKMDKQFGLLALQSPNHPIPVLMDKDYRDLEVIRWDRYSGTFFAKDPIDKLVTFSVKQPRPTTVISGYPLDFDLFASAQTLRLVYIDALVTGPLLLHLIDLDRRTLKPKAETLQSIQAGNIVYARFSPDGTHLATMTFTIEFGTDNIDFAPLYCLGKQSPGCFQDLYIRDKSGERSIDDPLRGFYERWSFPIFSPTGNRLAFTCGGDVCLLNTNGTHFQPFTTGQDDTRRVFWDLDGTSLIYTTDHTVHRIAIAEKTDTLLFKEPQKWLDSDLSALVSEEEAQQLLSLKVPQPKLTDPLEPLDLYEVCRPDNPNIRVLRLVNWNPVFIPYTIKFIDITTGKPIAIYPTDDIRPEKTGKPGQKEYLLVSTNSELDIVLVANGVTRTIRTNRGQCRVDIDIVR